MTTEWDNAAYIKATGDTDFEHVPSRVMANWYKVRSFGAEAFVWQKKQRNLLLLPTDEREALIQQLKQDYFQPIYADFMTNGWSDDSTTSH